MNLNIWKSGHLEIWPPETRGAGAKPLLATDFCRSGFPAAIRVLCRGQETAPTTRLMMTSKLSGSRAGEPARLSYRKRAQAEMARTASTGAGPGTMMPGTLARRTGTGTIHRTGTTTSGSVVPRNDSNQASVLMPPVYGLADWGERLPNRLFPVFRRLVGAASQPRLSRQGCRSYPEHGGIKIAIVRRREVRLCPNLGAGRRLFWSAGACSRFHWSESPPALARSKLRENKAQASLRTPKKGGQG
jgi:hypothetical protein